MIIDNKSYTGDGSTRQYATSAIILSNSHIAVFLDNVLQPTNSYDLLGSVVLFKTAPSSGVAINFVVSDTGEDLPVTPNEYNTVYANITEIQNVNSIINQIVNLDAIKNEIVNVDGLSTEIIDLYNNRLAILGVYAINSDIASLNSIKSKLESLYADKTKLDSLYTDKSTLDGLYSSKLAIDELYSIKGKLDSLYADKATLDSIFADKITLDSLYADKSKLDSLYADKTELDSLYTNLTQLLTVYDNLTAVSSIYNNMTDVNYFADIYLGSKTSSPNLRNDGSALQVGDLYYNSSSKLMYAYDGTVWNTAYASVNSYSKSETENTLPNIGFNINAGVSVGIGQMAWNLDEGTLDIGQENSKLQLGQETQWNCRNNTGVTIPKGTPVMATGTIGASGRITIAPFDGTVKANARFYLGLATHDIISGADGKVTHFGKVRGIDTTGTPYGEVWSDGDLIYPSTTVVGALTNVEPTSSTAKIEYIQVIYAHANGTLAVRVNGTDQHKVAIDVFYDNSTSGLTSNTAQDAIDEVESRLDTAESKLSTIESGYVDLTGNQTIAGVKTFSSTISGSISGNAATVTNGVYTTGNQTIAGVKTFSSSPIVPTPTTGTQAVNKDYVDSLKTIATGTATFNAATNNINLTGIGIGVEIGDVIQISGAEDAKNNSEFTIEVITDANNIIVNQAHANKGTSKNIATRSSDTGVIVKLLAKWYNASNGLGQGWVNVTSTRISNTTYPNSTNRSIEVNIYISGSVQNNFVISDELVSTVVSGSIAGMHSNCVSKDENYKLSAGTATYWKEKR